MNREDRLFEIANTQQGYFTAKQAKEAGYYPGDNDFYVKNKKWLRIYRGIYKIKNYPQYHQFHPHLVPLSLWSRNKKGEPQGVFSHFTAAIYHGLLPHVSPLQETPVFMTVPKKFRHTGPHPQSLQLMYALLEPSEIHECPDRGYRVTSIVRTLYDMLEECGASEETLEMIRNAATKNLIGPQEALSLFTYYGEHVEEKT